MATPGVPDVTENWSDRRFVPGQFAQRGWIVTGVSNESEAITAVGSNAGVGGSFILDGRLLAQPADVTREGGPLAFHVVVQYRPREGDLAPAIDNLIEFEWEEGSSSEPSDVDAEGRAIVNAAGFPFSGNGFTLDKPLH